MVGAGVSGNGRKGGDPGRYAAIRSEVLQDGTLTSYARSVLFYLADKPPGWEVRTADVVSALCDVSAHKFEHDIRPELVRAGYLVREDIRDGRLVVARRVTVNRGRILWDERVPAGQHSNAGSRQVTTPEDAPGIAPGAETAGVPAGHVSNAGFQQCGDPARLVNTDIQVTPDKGVTTKYIPRDYDLEVPPWFKGSLSEYETWIRADAAARFGRPHIEDQTA